jgi:hypothetical protein
MPTEPAPSDLIAGLHRGETGSQALLKRWCREPIDRLRARHHLGHERELLIERTLHWTAMYLRVIRPARRRSPDPGRHAPRRRRSLWHQTWRCPPGVQRQGAQDHERLGHRPRGGQAPPRADQALARRRNPVAGDRRGATGHPVGSRPPRGAGRPGTACGQGPGTATPVVATSTIPRDPPRRERRPGPGLPGQAGPGGGRAAEARSGGSIASVNAGEASWPECSPTAVLASLCRSGRP